ncbi:MAG: DUF1015 domain-containing protein, partial [Rectinema sp.]|nr:DUF1015 domain-containing protein [Rectinema sp.]
MSASRERLQNLGVTIPELYLPAEGTSYRTWAVVACDQYSSEREYWEDVAREVGDAPSTLKLIFPECYLEDTDKDARIASIQRTMREYLANGVVASRGPAFMLVERTTPFETHPRLGLVVAIDLERYQYGKDSRSLVRPTEGTIVERLPPRMAIRRGAPLELPHIMILIDDPEKTVIEPLYRKRQYLEKAYDFDLMKNSGHIRGWLVRDEADLSGIAEALERLADPDAFRAKYGKDDVLLFAVGDGNHSLATAKAIWEETKASFAGRPDADQLLMGHPARYALVELVNLYDEGLPFHPIHRVLFGIDAGDFLASLQSAGADIRRTSDARQAFALVDSSANSREGHLFAFVTGQESGVIRFPNPTARLAVATIQERIDAYRKEHSTVGIDYIHGTASLESLGRKPGNLGLY